MNFYYEIAAMDRLTYPNIKKQVFVKALEESGAGHLKVISNP